MTLTGLDYPLERGVLPADACLGLGNHVAADGDARIVLHEGTVVVLVEWGGRVVPVASRGERRVTTASPLWRVAAVLWAAAIVISGVIPTSSTVHAISDGHDTLATTVAHFVAYAVLGFLLGVALGGWRVDARRLALGLALAAALGGAIELVQGPLSYRDAQVARLHRRRRRRRGRTRRLQCCGVGDATTIASRMMLAATSSAGTS